VPSVESNVHEGWRVLLDGDDLVVLQRLERPISEAIIIRNIEIIESKVIDQCYRLVVTIDGRFNGINSSPLSPPDNPDATMLFIENLIDERIRPTKISVRC
jgi:hypothetical protein